MFMRTIAVDGFGELSVHYVHRRSAAKDAIPLLFVHGCASSLFFFLEIPAGFSSVVVGARK